MPRHRPTCQNKALDLLSRRPHFRRELAFKLSRRGYDDDEVAGALDHLEGQRLLDDARTARDFVEHRLARGPVGPRRLLADLARRGAPEELAREAVEALYGDEDELVTAAAERWRRRSTRGSPEALGRHLERRGFSRRAIVAVLREAESAASNDES